jgi:hypothetical protein
MAKDRFKMPLEHDGKGLFQVRYYVCSLCNYLGSVQYKHAHRAKNALELLDSIVLVDE